MVKRDLKDTVLFQVSSVPVPPCCLHSGKAEEVLAGSLIPGKAVAGTWSWHMSQCVIRDLQRMLSPAQPQAAVEEASGIDG